MTSAQSFEAQPFSFEAIAMAVLDRDGNVLRWSLAAAELVGRTAVEVCGQPVFDLLATPPEQCSRGDGTGIPEVGRALLRHSSGGTIEVAFRAVALEASSELVLLAAPARCVTDWRQGSSLLHALLAQDRIGIGIHDADLSIVRTNNVTPELFGGPALPIGGRLADVMRPTDAVDLETALRHVLATGEPLIGHKQWMGTSEVGGREWCISLSAFRLESKEGDPPCVVALVTDSTKHQHSRRDLELRHQAANRIGTSLDVQRTAQDLIDVLVPALGDVGWVYLAEAVLDGDEPSKFLGGGELHMRRVAVASASGAWPPVLLEPGSALPPIQDSADLRSLQSGKTDVSTREGATAMVESREMIPQMIPEHGHSVLRSPLSARGLLLGILTLWRTENPEPFTREDAGLLEEITSRAALSVDNARRYTREHRAAVSLQQRLLPQATTDSAAAETAGVYRPAGGGAEIGGDWFDVIPLPSLRTALVVGDVVGHGLHASATMGRLRTAVQTLADLEHEPDELLTHLDDLVIRLASAEASTIDKEALSATCLYAVYDPVTCRCTLASAGHPPPILIRPDGTAQVIEDLSPGPPLGVGGMPFETSTLDLPTGSVLALYTDGLIKGNDLDLGIRHLADRLEALCQPDRALDETGRLLLADINASPRDDVTLLLARTRALPPENTASCALPAGPEIVADARAFTTRQLAAWGLEDAAFTTELIVSELVTNAVRYAGGPIGLQLIRDKVLICEVTDPSTTQPRLRRARTTDEGGRGLFLVAQLTARWGSRYGRSGKTIWTEQPLGL